MRVAGSIDGRVVDISAIPLSVIERVEIVTGGRSAIYGADAVAGVANLITRREFDGLETQAYFGFANEGGGERLQLSQIGGLSADRGGFVAAYDYSQDWTLDLADVGLLSREFIPTVGQAQLTLSAQVPTTRHSAYLSGRFDATDNIELVADGLYTLKEYDDFSEVLFGGASRNSSFRIRNQAENYSVSLGARVQLGHDWTMTASGGTSAVDNLSNETDFFDFGVFALDVQLKTRSRTAITTGSLVAEGPLFEIAGIRPRVAVGAEWRNEDFRTSQTAVGLSASEPFTNERDVTSLFGELVVPLIEHGGLGVRRLEASFAGRYDSYSDFGDTFNPQAGLIWEPLSGLTLRGNYASAFRAPALSEFGGFLTARVQRAADPTQGGANVPVLFIDGRNPDLGPEKAKTWSVGADLAPPSARWLRASISYFDVRYDGRIETPLVFADRPLALVRADRFPGFLDRSPTRDEVAAIIGGADNFVNQAGIPFNPATQNLLDVIPGLIFFDNRIANIASERLRALDGSIDTTFDGGSGTLNLGINATYTLEHSRRVTPTSPEFSLLDEVGKTADFRARGTAGWSRDAVSLFAYVNYIDGYDNPFSNPRSRISSWTTFDLTLRFDGSRLAATGFLNGFSAALSANNLFDADPPRFDDSLLGVRYDTTNANPFGRFVSLRLVKRW
jgi:outer membrane receptor protein involved in Fe transport